MGVNTSKGEPVKLKRESETDDAGFEDLGRYQGSKKDGKRHGQGIYFFNNGDIYDGEWRKGRKEGYGTYQFSDGKITQPQTPKSPDPDSDSDNEENDNIPKLKDPTGLDLRRAESMRRQQYFRAKYNIGDKNNDPEATKNDAHGLRDSIRAKWGLKRTVTIMQFGLGTTYNLLPDRLHDVLDNLY
ncbi:hypothetical protein QZH41_003037 [Actinostola sp. cb2023]|nr:hypothetical protein QZH41_003037 [Actinostola sp. cb2023]